MSWRVTRNGISASETRENSPSAADQVVLVAAVGVARGVGVVLEQVDLAVDALLGQPPLGVDHQALEDPLPRTVVDDQLAQVVALPRRVLGVAADVQVQPRPVAQEHVRAAPPGDDPAEQVPRHLVGAQPPLSAERAGDAVLGLDAVDAPPERINHRRARAAVAADPPERPARPVPLQHATSEAVDGDLARARPPRAACAGAAPSGQGRDGQAAPLRPATCPRAQCSPRCAAIDSDEPPIATKPCSSATDPSKVSR